MNQKKKKASPGITWHPTLPGLKPNFLRLSSPSATMLMYSPVLESPSNHTNRALSIFYSRAKQTFFTPNSPYALDLPSDILGPFHTPSFSSDFLNHPPNCDFSTSSSASCPHTPTPESSPRSRTRSVRYFRKAWTTNVGTARATCGFAGGTAIAPHHRELCFLRKPVA